MNLLSRSYTAFEKTIVYVWVVLFIIILVYGLYLIVNAMNNTGEISELEAWKIVYKKRKKKEMRIKPFNLTDFLIEKLRNAILKMGRRR